MSNDLIRVTITDKKDLSKGIADEIKRQAFLDGISGSYEVEKLHLSSAEPVSLNDGNDYVFSKCVLENIKLFFEGNSIVFENSVLIGEISMHNRGVGESDEVVLEHVDSSNQLTNLSISSSTIDIYDGQLYCDTSLSLMADECFIEESKLISPKVVVNYNSGCQVKKSSIENMFLHNNPITNPDDMISEDVLEIEESTINGQYISSLHLDNSDQSKEDTGRSK